MSRAAGVPASILKQLELKLGVKISAVVTGLGGDISAAAQLSLADGRSVFVKWNHSAPEGFFGAEADGLAELASAAVLPVPSVLFFEDAPVAGPPFIVMELLEAGAKSAECEAQLGQKLAQLHQRSARRFGYRRNNFIGRIPQDNTEERSWSEFFVSHRLIPQIELGQSAGWFDWRFEKLFAEKHPLIRDILSADESGPSLLHGDLWSGNVFWGANGPVLIDPAVFYGSREADLAFTELFGGFGPHFYLAYNETSPLSEGYHQRKAVLNLYHIMNHANLFGGSYVTLAYNQLQSLS